MAVEEIVRTRIIYDVDGEPIRTLTSEVKRLSDIELEAVQAAKLTEDSVKKLVRVGSSWFDVTADQVDATKLLSQAYNQALTPAQKTALMLERLEKETSDQVKATQEYKVALENLQVQKTVREFRELMNGGMSLSMLFQEQNELLQKLNVNFVLINNAGDSYAKQINDLNDQLAELEFNTDDATKATAEYQAKVTAVRSRVEALEKAEQERNEALAEGFTRQKKYLDSLETAADATGLPFAGLISKFKMASDSLETMQETGGEGAVKLLKVGMAAGVAVAAVAALAAGAAALTAAIVGAVAKAADFNEELVKFQDIKGFELITGDQLRNLEEASASVSAMGVVGKRFVVDVAEKFGPAVREASINLTALGLQGLDAFRQMGTAADIVRKIIVEIGSFSIQSLAAKASSSIAKKLGADTAAQYLEAFAVVNNEINKAQAGILYDFFGAPLVEGLKDLKLGTADYRAEAEKLIKTITDLTIADREYTQEAADAAEALADERAAIDERYFKSLLEETRRVNAEREKGEQALNDFFRTSRDQALADVKDRLDKRLALFNQTYEIERLAVEEGARAGTAFGRALEREYPRIVKTLTGIKDVVQETMAGIKIAIDGVVATITAGLSYLDQFVSLVTGASLSDLMSGVIDGESIDIAEYVADSIANFDWSGLIVDTAQGLVEVLRGVSKNPQVWGDIADAVAEAMHILATEGVPLFVEIAKAIVIGIGQNLDILIWGVVELAYHFVVEVGKGLLEIWKGEASFVWDAITGAGDWVVDKISGWFFGIWDGIKAWFSGILEFLGIETGTSGGGFSAQQITGAPPVMSTDSIIQASTRQQAVILAPGDKAYIGQAGGPNDALAIWRNMGQNQQTIISLLREQNELLRDQRVSSGRRTQVIFARPAGALR